MNCVSFTGVQGYRGERGGGERERRENDGEEQEKSNLYLNPLTFHHYKYSYFMSVILKLFFYIVYIQYRLYIHTKVFVVVERILLFMVNIYFKTKEREREN